MPDFFQPIAVTCGGGLFVFHCNITEETMKDKNCKNSDNRTASISQSHEAYHRCQWCNELCPESELTREANIGLLCNRCITSIRSRGETLTTILI